MPKLRSLLLKLEASEFNRQFSNKAGFTLIELMVAISVIAIMAAIGLVAYSRVQANARDARRRQDVEAIVQALQVYGQNNNGLLPAGVTAGYVQTRLATTLVPGYMNSLPEDPQCTTAGSVPCYYYGLDSGGTKFGIFARMENAPSNAKTTCTNNAITDNTNYNYCYSP